MTMKKLFLMVIAVIFGVVAATAQDESHVSLPSRNARLCANV